MAQFIEPTRWHELPQMVSHKTVIFGYMVPSRAHGNCRFYCSNGFFLFSPSWILLYQSNIHTASYSLLGAIFQKLDFTLGSLSIENSIIYIFRKLSTSKTWKWQPNSGPKLGPKFSKIWPYCQNTDFSPVKCLNNYCNVINFIRIWCIFTSVALQWTFFGTFLDYLINFRWIWTICFKFSRATFRNVYKDIGIVRCVEADFSFRFVNLRISVLRPIYR